MQECIWCETQFEVTFDDASDVVVYCPVCGEKCDDPDSGEDFDPDGSFWDE